MCCIYLPGRVRSSAKHGQEGAEHCLCHHVRSVAALAAQALPSVHFVRPSSSCCNRRWLLGLLVLQSMSSFVLDSYQELLRNHLVVTLFLTMLVGAGGNAGNQSAIKVIRGLVHLCSLSIAVLIREERQHDAPVAATSNATCSRMSFTCRVSAQLLYDPFCSACRQLGGSRRPALPSGRLWHSSALWDCCWRQG